MTHKWTGGRYVRTVLGAIGLLVAFALIGLEIRAVVTVPTFKVEWEHVALHAMLVVTSWALIHKI